jgi:hypothetical protein
MHDTARLQGLQLDLGKAIALDAARIRIHPRHIATAKRRPIRIPFIGVHRPGLGSAIIPGIQVDRIGKHSRFGAPAIDAVGLHDRARLGKFHARPPVAPECPIVVGDDHRMLPARRAAWIAFVLEVVEQPLLVQKALDERQVALLILGGQAPSRVNSPIGYLDPPRRIQSCLALVSPEYGFENLDDVHILEDPAVAPKRHEGGPWLNGQQVSCKAAIRSGQLGRRYVPMKGAMAVARFSGEQLQQHRLTEQATQGQMGISRQRIDSETESGADRFLSARAFGQQFGTGRRVQREQAGILCEANE